MANQTNRLTYDYGKGGFIRIIWKPNVAVETASVVILPHTAYSYEFSPGLENMTESDSMGEYYAPTVQKNMIRVDLRRRQGLMSLDALGIRALSFVDRVLIDIGTSGRCDIIDHMAVDAYSRNAPQLAHITEGFSLIGGSVTSRNIAIPSYAQLGGTIPDIAAYYSASGSVPTGL